MNLKLLCQLPIRAFANNFRLAPPLRKCTVIRSFSTTEPSEKITRICDDIINLDMLEINQLLQGIAVRMGYPRDYLLNRALNIESGVSMGASNRGGGAPSTAAAEPPKVKEIFDVKLKAVDAKAKIKIIKEIRTITGLGLKEAKELVEKAPVVIKAGVKKDEADEINKVIVEAGGEIELV